MTENNVPNHIPDNMDVVVVIDKDKLPEDVRKMLEQNLPKDVSEQLKLSQEKVIEMLTHQSAKADSLLQKGKMDNIVQLQKDKPPDKEGIDNRLFAIQTGTVVGNIYTDGIYKKEELGIKKKKDETKEGLDGCC